MAINKDLGDTRTPNFIAILFSEDPMTGADWINDIPGFGSPRGVMFSSLKEATREYDYAISGDASRSLPSAINEPGNNIHVIFPGTPLSTGDYFSEIEDLTLFTTASIAFSVP